MSEIITITVKANEVKLEEDIKWKAPSNLAEMVEAFGEERTYNLAIRMAKADIANGARRELNNAADVTSVLEKYAAWEPGLSSGGTKQDPVQGVLKRLNDPDDPFSIEDLKKLLATAQGQPAQDQPQA